jgi:CubicO group peptidase (beta-lactamase class C family)
VWQYCVSRYQTGELRANPLLFDGVRVISALLALALLQVPNALPPSRDQLFALFGRYLDALRVQAGIPGLAAAIIDSDGIAWQQAYGQQDTSRSLLTRTDTPFHLDGLTQIFAATLVLRCVEDGRLTLDTPIGAFSPDSPDAAATVGQILTHTSGDPRDPTFLYRPARLDVLASVVSACTGLSFRVAVAGLLNSQAMGDSVPGPDAPKDPALVEDSERYASVLERLAVPYAVDDDKRASPSHYVPTTLTPSAGLISTVLNFAEFDRGLRQGFLLREDTLAAAWRPPVGKNGSLPHGYGWFVQTYRNEPVIWQFGMGANASSSLVLTLPARDLTLVMVANSDGLAKPTTLASGDIIVSPFARMFFQLLIK